MKYTVSTIIHSIAITKDEFKSEKLSLPQLREKAKEYAFPVFIREYGDGHGKGVAPTVYSQYILAQVKDQSHRFDYDKYLAELKGVRSFITEDVRRMFDLTYVKARHLVMQLTDAGYLVRTGKKPTRYEAKRCITK